jgi:hypothetical protein
MSTLIVEWLKLWVTPILSKSNIIPGSTFGVAFGSSRTEQIYDPVAWVQFLWTSRTVYIKLHS